MVLKRELPSVVLSVRTEPTPHTPADYYLDLIKKVLTRALLAKGSERSTVYPHGRKSTFIWRLNRIVARRSYEIVRLVRSGANDYLESGHAALNRVEDAETMLGTRQLDSMQRCIADVLAQKIPGDLLEAGVWRGGMTIFMKACLAAYGGLDRRLWVTDSFQGLPSVDKEYESFEWRKGDMAVPLEEVKENFARYGLLDEGVVFLKGFFADTLPDAPISSLSILRVDADLYQSTLDVLRNLYPKLSVGGYAIFDDYQNLPDCRRAVDQFRSEHGIKEEIVPIDSRAVLWKKQV